MNKLYSLLIAIFIISGFYSCKKDAKEPTKTTTTTVDYKALLIGKWERTSIVDTLIIDGSISPSSGPTYNDITYIFNTDGTGKVYQSTTLVFDIKYAVKNPNINVTVTQGYNQDGSVSSVHILPFSLHFTQLTDSKMVLHTDTTTVTNGVTWRQITYDSYTKFP